MTPQQMALLRGVAQNFHEDFDLDPMSAEDLLVAYARGLSAEARAEFQAAVEDLVQSNPEEDQHMRAWWLAGARFAPDRSEVVAFLALCRTPEGQRQIDGPGPVVHPPISPVPRR